MWITLFALLYKLDSFTATGLETAIDEAETPKKEGGAKGEHATPENKDELKASHTEEQQKDSKNRPAVDAAYAAEGVNPLQSSEYKATSGYAFSKRSLDTTDKKTTDSHAEEPPAKTTMTRRASIRPRPNILPDRKDANKPTQTTDHARLADGPETSRHRLDVVVSTELRGFLSSRLNNVKQPNA
ncbi:hypothetical protein HPB50_028614 [Hyalomma asiaticum]|nr:hypothetical protein HPB50_028614 [Hyalomma asiaticum]